ncbi:DUF5327 family protein [Staphylococcus warneri]|uniref:DUF5327 family protein n=1 Tax=Staphylococcus warneri TaxID=1292 RepID=UPI00066DAAEE|nr:DUF5327 family protein [Staphylococcus warneri]MBY6179843.1 YwdI family protein [Staphylococcaceae bacterium DP2N0-1]RQM99488.1 hypothetical protein CPA44_03395 [Staphylococcus warneri]
MDKDKIIQLIERELVQADESSSQHEFEKHMYAIHTITSLYTTSSMQSLQHNDFTHTDIDTQHKLMKTTNQQKSYDHVTPEEIQAMGGKVTHTNHSNKEQSSSTLSNSNLMTTDDEIGNGESIFDF